MRRKAEVKPIVSAKRGSRVRVRRYWTIVVGEGEQVGGVW